MGHKRVKMELIKNDRTRMQTYNKRKANLLKKMKEFTILCDVKACLIIFGPNTNSLESELETWAPDSCNIQDLIQQYRTSDQPRRNYSDSDYFAEKKKRVDVEIAKLSKQYYKHKFPTTTFDDHDQLSRLSADELRLILGSLDSKLKDADDRIAALNARRNLGLVQHPHQAVPLNTWYQNNPDVGFGIQRDHYDIGYDDVQHLSRHCQFEQRNLNNNNHNNNYNYNSSCFDNYYTSNNSLGFPAQGQQNFFAFQQPGDQFMPDIGSRANEFNFELIKNEVMGRNEQLNSLPGTSTRIPWDFDSAVNSDAGLSLISSSSYKQPIQMFDGSIGGCLEFYGRDRML
ncbi:Agamous-like MADS-box protein AGL82 [Linum grandiflorum]